MIYTANTKNCISIKNLSDEFCSPLHTNPGSVSRLIQEINKLVKHPVPENMLFEIECQHCKSFRVNTEWFYRFCAEAMELYYRNEETIEKEFPDEYQILEELADVAHAITVPFITEEHEPVSGIHTGHDDWDYDQETGWPLVLTVRSIWFGEKCGSCKNV